MTKRTTGGRVRRRWRAWPRWIRWPLIGAGAAFALGLVLFLFLWFSVDLPEDPPELQSAVLVAEDGRELAVLSQEGQRFIVPLDEVNPVVIDALLSAEDRRFYEHGGVDPIGLTRALVNNVRTSGTQGGSTLTQQLVKNALIGSNEQTYQRKIQEAALALRMEREYTKDQIFEKYLNQIYLANGVYGIGTASEFYFRKPADKLNLQQAALLAGMIQLPNDYDPVRNPKAARDRRNVVIDRMEELGWVTAKEAEKARKAAIKLRLQREPDSKPPFAVQFVTEELLDTENQAFDDVLGTTREEREEALGTGGYKIVTTLDPDMIEAAEKAATANLGLNGVQAAIATVEVKNGAIRSLMSGQNYDKQQRNLVVARKVGKVYQGTRQPGSAFKPFTLVAAFEQGIPPETRFSSASPFRTDEWDNSCNCVTNAEGASSGGMIDLYEATANSTNVVFAQLALKIGPEAIVKAANAMGITTPLTPVPSITLGSEEASPLDMASAFATLADEGTYCKPFVITRIVSEKGKVVYKHKDNCKEVIDPDVANLVTQMLEGVVRGGTGSAASLGSRPVAGKTGTSQDQADLWFVGYVPQYSTAVWVGNPKGRTPQSGYGGTTAAPIWQDYMLSVVRGVGIEDFAKPEKKIKPPVEKLPDVVGMQEEEAVEALQKAGFSATTNEVDDEARKGEVLAQSPSGGSKVTIDTTVRLDVSSGQPPAERVPSVTGMQVNEASREIGDAGFEIRIAYTTVNQEEKNRMVIRQEPGGGAQLEEGGRVTLVVGDYDKA